MNNAQVFENVILCLGMAGMFLVSYFLIAALREIRRTIAKLPLNIPEKREIVLAPREQARQGDVQFHFPNSMLFKDES